MYCHLEIAQLAFVHDDIVSFLKVVSLGAGAKKDISSWVGGGDRSPVFAAGPINFPSFARCPNAPATLPPVPIIRSFSLTSFSPHPNTNHCTTFSSVLIQSMVCNSYRAHFPTPAHPSPPQTSSSGPLSVSIPLHLSLRRLCARLNSVKASNLYLLHLVHLVHIAVAVWGMHLIS